MREREHECLSAFVRASEGFFGSVGGVVHGAFWGRRRNIEVLDCRLNPEVLMCSLEVDFAEAAKFGTGNFADAYSRYRRLRSDWWRTLTANEFQLWNPSMSVVGHFVPLLSAEHVVGTPYEREQQPVYGSTLTRIADLNGANPYYDAVRRKYQVEWVLADQNGIVIGPDLGLLYSVIAAGRTGDTRVFVDVGGGTGELSAYVMRRVSSCERLTVVEFSPYLVEHLKTYLNGIREGHRVITEWQFTDAMNMELPAAIDLMSVGIYYGAQPPFIEKYGANLSSALGSEGVMVMQTGMQEGNFNIGAVTGADARLKAWKWFDERLTIGHYFKHVSTFLVADEVITVASNSAARVERLKQHLREEGVYAELPMLERLVGHDARPPMSQNQASPIAAAEC